MQSVQEKKIERNAKEINLSNIYHIRVDYEMISCHSFMEYKYNAK